MEREVQLGSYEFELEVEIEEVRGARVNGRIARQQYRQEVTRHKYKKKDSAMNTHNEQTLT
jgi:ribosomal protein L21